ncbi:MAG: acyltransferase [Lachnospiraceae bacterium]|nr:acyltransferase [Lachnospiraceae bacterium]
MALSEYFVFLGKALVQDDVYAHLWFLYTLIGFMLSTPFLSKMFSAMKDDEVRLLGISILIWNFVSIYLCADMGLSLGITGWIFSGWIWAYLAGYIFNRLELDRYEVPIYILGIIGYIGTVFGNTYIAGFVSPADLSAGFLLFSIAGFCFMKKRIKIRNEKSAKVISFLGKHTFTAYIIHIYVMGHLSNRVVASDKGVAEWIMSILITFASSLVAAVIMDKLLVETMQKVITLVSGRLKHKTQ